MCVCVCVCVKSIYIYITALFCTLLKKYYFEFEMLSGRCILEVLIELVRLQKPFILTICNINHLVLHGLTFPVIRFVIQYFYMYFKCILNINMARK